MRHLRIVARRSKCDQLAVDGAKLGFSTSYDDSVRENVDDGSDASTKEHSAIQNSFNLLFCRAEKRELLCRLYTKHLTVRTHTRFFLVRTKHVMTARVAPNCQVLRVSQNHFISDHVSLECSVLSFSSDSVSLQQPVL